MSTWVAFAAKGAAVAGTGSAGGGISRAITPGALYGFAAGTLLTGLCLLVIVTLRRARRAARPDYYAAPGDTHSSVGEPADFPLPTDFPEPAELRAPELVAAPVVYEEPVEPELPLEFGDPVVEMLAPEASDDEYEEEEEEEAAESAPDAPGSFLPNPFARDPFDEDPSMPDRYAAAEAFGSSGYDDDDILLPGDDDAQHSSRGYRSKHRLTAADTMGRRPEARHRAPRHAAPAARFSSRMSSRQAPAPMVPAGG